MSKKVRIVKADEDEHIKVVRESSSSSFEVADDPRMMMLLFGCGALIVVPSVIAGAVDEGVTGAIMMFLLSSMLSIIFAPILGVLFLGIWKLFKWLKK